MHTKRGQELADRSQLSVFDGIYNSLANLGTSRDQRYNTSFKTIRTLSDVDLFTQWDTDWISGKIVDIPIDDMTREWRVFDGVDRKLNKDVRHMEELFGLQSKTNDWGKYGRLYGTAYMFLVTNSSNFETPLKWFNNKEKLENILIYDATELSPGNTLVTDPRSPHFRLPEYYTINETNIRIHTSRLLKFNGINLPYKELRSNKWRHRSILQRVYEAVLNAGILQEGVASMIFNTNIDVIKVPNLLNIVKNPTLKANLQDRFEAAARLKAFNNMLLIDEKEDYTKKNNSFSGLDGLLGEYLGICSGAADIPKTRLLGASPGGLNATGDSDTKNYFDMIASLQKNRLAFNLKIVDFQIANALGYKDDMDFSFPPLFQLNDKEKADAKHKDAQANKTYIETGVATHKDIQMDLENKRVFKNLTGNGVVKNVDQNNEEPEDENV